MNKHTFESKEALHRFQELVRERARLGGREEPMFETTYRNLQGPFRVRVLPPPPADAPIRSLANALGGELGMELTPEEVFVPYDEALAAEYCECHESDWCEHGRDG